jgi:hypothetical protein
MVGYACNSSYLGGVGRRIVDPRPRGDRGGSGKKQEILSKEN